jgi:hypothetical protein
MIMHKHWIWMTFIVVLIAGWVQAQPNPRDPHIGFLYPAGGQRGTEVTLTAGGQNLRGGRQVTVSGTGVKAEILQYCPPLANLGVEERQEIQRRFREAFIAKLEEATGKPLPELRGKPADKPAPDTLKIPSHPLLDDLDKRSLRELVHIRMSLFPDRTKLQMNRQIAEGVLVKVTIAPDAEPGDREMRILTAGGLSNPIVFQVGTLPEILEMEPNADESLQAFPELSKIPKFTDYIRPPTLSLPVMLNGQVMPGDIDHFRFSAKEGQHVVIEARARALNPYLADAVPGWLQATLTLYDSTGKEVAFVDDYRFHPDPTMMVRIPRTGEYELEIRDAIYRGREDFVYRVSLGCQPYITQAFPMGGRAGQPTTAEVEGWNLSTKQLPLDTTPEGPHIRQAVLKEGDTPSNPILYAVDTLPELNETESNDTPAQAQRVPVPILINGRIDKDGDEDVFRLDLTAGQDIVAEVYGRRLDSPIDSLLRLTDEKGNTLALNDDNIVKDNNLYTDAQGLVTHPADSWLQIKIPTSGVYYLRISDTQDHGSSAHVYRLRISPPQPGFDLRMTPSSLTLRAGIPMPVMVYALRRDGFTSPIDVVLSQGSGIRLDGGRIPEGVDRIRMTLVSLGSTAEGLVSIQLEGRAQIGGKEIHSPVVPAEDRMQAFLYRHLVPSQGLIVAVDKPKWSPLIESAGRDPIRIPAGGQAEVVLRTPRRPAAQKCQLELLDPPAGISLGPVTASQGQLQFIIKADKESPKIGFQDNLIVELMAERPRMKDGQPTGQFDRFSAGVLPAIPVRVVEATAIEPAKPPESKPAVERNPARPKVNPNKPKRQANKPQ